MSQNKVFSGYVVGSDRVGKSQNEVWKVRVVDNCSELNNKKLEVATSPHTLVKGLEVEFIIGSVLIGKKSVLKAFEVKVKQVREGGSNES